MSGRIEKAADGRDRVNIRLVVEYDGSGFLGFQKQSRGRTVQGELERAASALFREPVRVLGSGRTDAGVHARGQVVNFHAPGAVPVKSIRSALNQMLPADVVVRDAAPVGPEFHARYSAEERVYEYTILNRGLPSALESRFVWHVPDRLDIQAMCGAAEALSGEHDFSAFGTAEEGRSPVRRVSRLEVSARKPYVKIECAANAFLRHMARGLAGAIVDVGRGAAAIETLRGALNGERPALTIAPPGGLCLVAVNYGGESLNAGVCTERV